jgi:hypothetical protein
LRFNNVDIPRHIAKRWPIHSGDGRLLVKYFNSRDFKFLKMTGDRGDKDRVVKK